MPLLLLYGPPLSGKSLAAQEIALAARQRGLDARVLTDDSVGFTPKMLFTQPGAVHARLKQQVLQFLSQDRLAIVDFVNCTKSFRYELFCIARTCRTRNCVLAPKAAFRQGVAAEELLRPSREQYARILEAHSLMLKFFEPGGAASGEEGQREATAAKRAEGPFSAEIWGSGWTYESYTDICSRLEPLLPEQKADNPVFLFSLDDSAKASENSLSAVCGAVLEYLYPTPKKNAKRKKATERLEVQDDPAQARPEAFGFRGPQGTSAEVEEELLRRITPILSSYLP